MMFTLYYMEMGNGFPAPPYNTIMQYPAFTNVYWDLNIKNSYCQRGPPEPGAPCHGITGILVNPAMLTVGGKIILNNDCSVSIRVT